LNVTCDGYIRQKFPKKVVLDGAHQTANIQFALDPAPIVTGWVLDSYGEPNPNVLVEALRRTYDAGGSPRLTRLASGLTDDRGQYRIFWLDPGDYYFYASSPLPEGPGTLPVRVAEPTYFPGVNTPEDAKAVHLEVGREVEVDFRIRSAGLWDLAGQTIDATTSRSTVAAVSLTAPQQDPRTSQFQTTSSGPGLFAGEFAISGIPPGSFLLTAKSGSGNQVVTAYERIVLRPALITGPPPYRTTLTLYPPFSIKGRLFVDANESIPDLRNARIELISTDPDFPSPRAVALQRDGQFTVPGVSPGSYAVEVSSLPEDFYVKASRYGDNPPLQKSFTLDPRKVPGALQVLLASDGGRLQVTSYDAADQLAAGAQFVLVPDNARRDRRDQYRILTADDDGQATFRGIPPGAYKLFSWESVEPNGYLNADYLRSYESFGVPVYIMAGDNPPMTVRWIPKD
jgi:hypothetical protein